MKIKESIDKELKKEKREALALVTYAMTPGACHSCMMSLAGKELLVAVRPST